jgi:hypothetical protein
VAAGQTLLGTLGQLLQHEADAVLAADAGGIPALVRLLRLGNGLAASGAAALAALFDLLPRHNDHMLDAVPVLVGLLMQERPYELEVRSAFVLCVCVNV